MIKKIILLLLMLPICYAADYYVDKNSAACLDGGTGSQSVPWCTITKATSTVIAGDTVIIKPGNYNEVLKPANSGTASNQITYRADGNVVIRDVNSYDPRAESHPEDPNPYYGPIWIEDKHHIIFDGLELTNSKAFVRAVRANNITFKNCNFHDPTSGWTINLAFFESNDNKLIDNTFRGSGGDTVRFIHSNKNVVEGNQFYDAGHVLLTFKCSSNNVIRNNYFYNSLEKTMEIFDCERDTMFDHRNIPYYQDTQIVDSSKRNLVEGNDFAYTPSSGDSSPYAGIQYAGQYGIIRKNRFYDTVGPGFDLTYYSTEAMYDYKNRVYNNVFFGTDFAGISMSGTTSPNYHDQIFKNNIAAKSIFVANDKRWTWYTNILSGKPVQVMTGRNSGFYFEKNNFFNEIKGEDYIITYGTRTSTSNPLQHNLSWWQETYPLLFSSNYEEDPKFVDDDNFDFHLQDSSLMIDTGAFLTKTTNSGPGTQMRVVDAGYFYDGFSILGEFGDKIQAEGNLNSVQIKSIDYNTNTITLTESYDWSSGDGVSLLYSGSAPDIGAFEYGLDAECSSDSDCSSQICCNTFCVDAVCSSDGDCDDGIASTVDSCANAGECGAVCVNEAAVVPDCIIGSLISSICKCSGVERSNGYCCSDGYKSYPCSYECIDDNQCSGKICCNNNCVLPACILDNDCDAGYSCLDPNSCDATCVGSCSEGDFMACGSDVGACSSGNRICTSGIWGDCVGAVNAVTEVCNGLDDDCDGTVDESLSGCTVPVMPACTPVWECSDWGECSFRGRMSRTCTDINSCGTSTGRPELSKSCDIQNAVEDKSQVTSSSRGSSRSGIRGVAVEEVNVSSYKAEEQIKQKSSSGLFYIILLMVVIAGVVYYVYTKRGIILNKNISKEESPSRLSDQFESIDVLRQEISALKQNGQSDGKIKRMLIANGWEERVVDEALKN